jgi:hypothetical protein
MITNTGSIFSSTSSLTTAINTAVNTTSTLTPAERIIRKSLSNIGEAMTDIMIKLEGMEKRNLRKSVNAEMLEENRDTLDFMNAVIKRLTREMNSAKAMEEETNEKIENLPTASSRTNMRIERDALGFNSRFARQKTGQIVFMQNSNIFLFS